jgi:hypothetical protein
MEGGIFRVITPCNSIEVHRRFGETYHLHLQGRKVIEARNQRKQAADSIPRSVDELVVVYRVLQFVI